MPKRPALGDHRGEGRTKFATGILIEMRVLVGVKRVVDYAVKVRIQPDKAGTPQLCKLVNSVTSRL